MHVLMKKREMSCRNLSSDSDWRWTSDCPTAASVVVIRRSTNKRLRQRGSGLSNLVLGGCICCSRGGHRVFREHRRDLRDRLRRCCRYELMVLVA